MSDDLRERLPDEALSDDPAVRGTRSDIGATGGGLVGAAPGMQEHDRESMQSERATDDPVRRTRPDADGNSSGSAMDSGDGEPGRGAASDDETDWMRSASGAGRAVDGDAARDEGIAARGPDAAGAQGIRTE